MPTVGHATMYVATVSGVSTTVVCAIQFEFEH